MSMRFEWIDAKDTDVSLVGPGVNVDGSDEEPNDETTVKDHALMLGDPGATALVVAGSLVELRAFAQRILGALPGQQSVSEPHSDGSGLAELVRRAFPGALSVRLTTEEWDNGFFYSDEVEVTMGDGAVVTATGDGMGDVGWSELVSELSERDGLLGRSSELTITL